MKKLFYYSALLMIILLISSCGKSSASIPATPKEDPAPAYFGNWTVHKLVGSAPISTEADKSIIGMNATYTQEKAAFGDNEIVNPQYEQLEMSNDEFFAEYRTQLSEIGINTQSVNVVRVRDWTSPGSVLIMEDEQTMITVWDGNFFELQKE
ncbi:hypothetical protein [Paenibacillus xerothermodurans]|uniref:Lipocalin-like domain-containing protein n=1 Tax=Paenibacillus xerothermodurans TaxID=1977292 RepID=A0A2W1NW01_PAEXE|nr:hypothetical protein [Paenibacillus xerothermodurans]PZE19872.1 hypothetical protein CBW46_016230 [Paenibacillus xerothermodurans]